MREHQFFAVGGSLDKTALSTALVQVELYPIRIELPVQLFAAQGMVSD